MDYSSMDSNQRKSSYQLLNALAIRIADLDRHAAGQHNALALIFAYDQVEKIIEQQQLELFDSYPPETD